MLVISSLDSSQDQSGLKSKELTSILARMRSNRDAFAKGKPDYWRQREELASDVEQKLGGQRRGSDPAPESQGRSRQTVQGQCKSHVLKCWNKLILLQFTRVTKALRLF